MEGSQPPRAASKKDLHQHDPTGVKKIVVKQRSDQGDAITISALLSMPSFITLVAYPMFELVGTFIFLLVQIDEVVGNPIHVSNIHGPRNSEGVTGDIVDLDAVRGGQQLHDPTNLAPTVVTEKRGLSRRLGL